MDVTNDMDIISEDYKQAKNELLTTVELQYKILSILVTATAAVFVYIMDRDENEIRQLVFCACLIVPGLFAFFGILWLDQVYRQRRLAAYIYTLEELYRQMDTCYGGLEHFVLGDRGKDRLNWPSRFYYYICAGLFFFFPPATYILACLYKAGNVLSAHHELHGPAWFGIALYLAFLFFAVLYIRSILLLANVFRGSTDLNDTINPAA